jgi:hypothetical protein
MTAATTSTESRALLASGHTARTIALTPRSAPNPMKALRVLAPRTSATSYPITNVNTAAIDTSWVNRPHDGIGPWNATLPTPTATTAAAYTVSTARWEDRATRARLRSRMPATT